MFVYLDNSATTRQYDRVTEEMVRMMGADYGNPSSLHRMGVTAEGAVNGARKTIGDSIKAHKDEIFFTGSGTEADNLAICGAYKAGRRRGKRIITSSGEHPAVLEACKQLDAAGAEVIYLGIDNKGLIDLDELSYNLNDSTILISIMAVNNELGTIAPLEKIGSLVKLCENALFHTDCVQAYGKIPIDPEKCGIDMLSLSGHKIHGPKGTGALYVKKGVRIEALIFGGGQEKGLRAGTENTPGIAGLGKAAEIIHNCFSERITKLGTLRAYLLEGITNEIPDVIINSPEARLSSPGILNVSFMGCRGEVLLHFLEQRDIYVSTGAACSSKKGGSRVLAAAGLAAPVIDSAIRFSFSEFNTIEQMDYVLTELKKAVTSMRGLRRIRR
ncbi:cysteine desulfurase family protein [Bacillota bacterium]